MDGPKDSPECPCDAMRIAIDHLRAEKVNLARDNAELRAKIRVLENIANSAAIVASQGFGVKPNLSEGA